MTNFLISCSGASREVLKQCPSENNKFIGTGSAILLTSIMAAISGGYAIYFTFNSYAAATIFGLLWGAIIFNLDRYIITSIKSVYGAIPRILIALILSITISKPIELKLFEGSIRGIINERAANVMDEFNVRRENIIKQVNGYQKQNIVVLESDPFVKDVTDKINDLNHKIKILSKDTSLLAKRSVAALNKEKSELNKKLSVRRQEIYQNTRAGELSQISNLSTLHRQLQEIDSLKSRSVESKDLLARLSALSVLTSRNTTAAISSYLITALFALIELSPLIIKLLLPRGVYDVLLDERDNDIIALREMRQNALINKEKYRISIEFKSHQTVVDYRAKKFVYLEKVVVDKEYDSKLTKINKL